MKTEWKTKQTCLSVLSRALEMRLCSQKMLIIAQVFVGLGATWDQQRVFLGAFLGVVSKGVVHLILFLVENTKAGRGFPEETKEEFQMKDLLKGEKIF